MIIFVVILIFVSTGYSSQPQVVTNESDIKIFFYSQKHIDNAMEIHHSDYKNSVGKTDFDYTKHTVFTVHGWHNEVESAFCQDVKDAYLKVQDVNVFVIDWNAIAKHFYIAAYVAVPDVGKVLGKLIKSMVTHNKLNLNMTLIVGHSLGAHVAGLAGATLGGQIDTIIGLDAAWPFFSIEHLENRLDTTDAKFVQIVHTCAGLLGFPEAIGHADYYANDGRWQPGCGHDYVGLCAHSRAYKYFSESLVADNFIARKCADWSAFKMGNCSAEPTSYMGQYGTDKSAVGTYYFETNGQSPYGKGYNDE